MPDHDDERLREALGDLVTAVEAHQRFWARVDWGSERCERAVLTALDRAKAVLDD